MTSVLCRCDESTVDVFESSFLNVVRVIVLLFVFVCELCDICDSSLANTPLLWFAGDDCGVASCASELL